MRHTTMAHTLRQLVLGFTLGQCSCELHFILFSSIIDGCLAIILKACGRQTRSQVTLLRATNWSWLIVTETYFKARNAKGFLSKSVKQVYSSDYILFSFLSPVDLSFCYSKLISSIECQARWRTCGSQGRRGRRRLRIGT